MNIFIGHSYNLCIMLVNATTKIALIKSHENQLKAKTHKVSTTAILEPQEKERYYPILANKSDTDHAQNCKFKVQQRKD